MMGSIGWVRACHRVVSALRAHQSTRRICVPVKYLRNPGSRLASGPPCAIETFRSINQSKFSERTHTCDEVSEKDVGKEVTLCGWLNFKRMQFIILRDGFGVTQVLLNEKLAKIIVEAPIESVLRVKGTVAKRPQGQERQDLSTGQVEIVAEDITVLNPSSELPMHPREYQKKTEPLRLKYRYIDLRHTEMQRNMRLRSKLTNAFRNRLVDSYGFCEVETPTLFRRTPGGAREFPVACHSLPHEFYHLVQSPQQFKQLLMVGSIDRYFQIARCYRDEGSRPDRQPEFTQVDIEMSFVTMENLINLLEDLVRAVWPTSLPPFPRISYQQAMTQYGTDKPDLRYAFLIEDAQELLPTVAESLPEGHRILALRLPKGGEVMKRKHLDEWQKVAQQFGLKGVSEVIAREDGSIKSPIAKIVNRDKIEKGSVQIIAWGPESSVLKTLGKVRIDFARLSGALEGKAEDFKFAWITGFPLFSEDADGKLISEHHPFTAPHDEDVALLDSDPLKVRSQHFDLVLNGWEVGGGSIRIHSSNLQEKILRDLLQEDCSELEHLLAALGSGAPPHGGFAFGLDRLLAILCNAPSIRDVIAFPKTAEGRDLMANAPKALSDEELEFFHLKTLQCKDAGRTPGSTE